jgi:multidrug efflux pump
MTSVATVCGHFPLTLVSGAGAAARNSIGITVVAGMALGTIFTLLVIPSIYVLIAKEHAGEDIGKLVVETPTTKSEPLEPAMAKQWFGRI